MGHPADDELSSETYDQDGNVTAADGKTFTYDSQNELVTMNGGAVQMLYDGDGNRVAKAVTSGGVTTTTYYLVDDLNPTGLPQVMDELTNGVVTRTYTYGLQRISEDQIVNGAWTPSYYSYDGMGSVRQLTNTAGAVTDSYEYDAFGNQISHTGSTPNNYLYRGEQWDSDLGLYYLRARYYNPLSGRFMSRDPNNGKVFEPKTLQRYLYADGDPINGIDPTGRADTVEEFQIDTYNSLTYQGDVAGKAGDLEFHHIIPARFACVLGVTEGVMLAVALDPATHQWFDNEWADFAELDGEPCEQAIQDIYDAAQEIYADEPWILGPINRWFQENVAAGALEY